jgi:hypothetical protein
VLDKPRIVTLDWKPLVVGNPLCPDIMLTDPPNDPDPARKSMEPARSVPDDAPTESKMLPVDPLNDVPVAILRSPVRNGDEPVDISKGPDCFVEVDVSIMMAPLSPTSPSPLEITMEPPVPKEDPPNNDTTPPDDVLE